MKIPLQITIRDIPASDALEARIRKKAAKLEEFHPRITRCRVMVEEARKHHHRGRQFSVRLDVRVPGREIAVTREHDEDVYVALRDAFDDAGRQLEDVAREMRGDIKAHDVPQHGKVTRLITDEGYGFIETEDGRELYFSRDNVMHPTFEELSYGTPVQFIEDWADEGPQAKRVSVGRHGV
ncbi:MAG: 30S ribosomal protein S30 [Betaproteobacteria bacterium RBG_16_64_9]|nr:MAG: 30S ribosomal protein S30 [Betaproteobacteria bacterium RBG_16_64_9]OGA22407.1 MAG: 30S ribosomal protein S30 [Betaproteobacteria bacterium RIFCSPLOWO2_02_FULL_65_24]OGA97028.1 MAG: 30S ribosomal protein S30 [Betaproteobacteria bacterium RIFCSPLOWO2_12_FULL_66_14]